MKEVEWDSHSQFEEWKMKGTRLPWFLKRQKFSWWMFAFWYHLHFSVVLSLSPSFSSQMKRESYFLKTCECVATNQTIIRTVVSEYATQQPVLGNFLSLSLSFFSFLSILFLLSLAIKGRFLFVFRKVGKECLGTKSKNWKERIVERRRIRKEERLCPWLGHALLAISSFVISFVLSRCNYELMTALMSSFFFILFLSILSLSLFRKYLSFLIFFPFSPRSRKGR